MSAEKSQFLAVQLAKSFDIHRLPIMAIMSFYCDESGKFHDKKVVSFCGVSGIPDTIHRFEEKWQELLRRHELSYLKMSEALNSNLPLSAKIPSQTIAQRIEALKPFAACIGENFEHAIAMCVGVEAFSRTKEHVKNQIAGGKNPFYFSFLNVMLACIQRAGGNSVSLICDDDQETAKNCLYLYRKVKNLGREKEEFRPLASLSAITFADDAIFSPLQAADMVSGLFRLEGGSRLLNEKYDYLRLLEYMVEDRGPLRTNWGFIFQGERKMARIEMSWGSQIK